MNNIQSIIDYKFSEIEKLIEKFHEKFYHSSNLTYNGQYIASRKIMNLWKEILELEKLGNY